MAMRKDEIPDNKFTLPLDARDLALYTRQITKNAKIFDPEIDAHLPGQLRATADQIYFDIFEANSIRVAGRKLPCKEPSAMPALWQANNSRRTWPPCGVLSAITRLLLARRTEKQCKKMK